MHGTIAAVILAGGEGRRLGGADKALLALAGKPLLAHTLARLEPQTPWIMLSANGNPARFDAFGLPVIADKAVDMGPLAGIAAAAVACRDRWPAARWLATVPVDTPLLPDDLLRRLADAEPAETRLARVAMAGGRPHWTMALWPVEAAISLERLMRENGVRRLQDGLAAVGWLAVPFQRETAFTNINRKEDLGIVCRLLSDF